MYCAPSSLARSPSSSQNTHPAWIVGGASAPFTERKTVAVRVELGHHGVPRLLRDDQDADAELGHDPARLRRDGRGVAAAAERLERPRPELTLGLREERALVLHEAGLESIEHHLGGLDEAAPRLVHRDAEAVELDEAEPATDAEDDPAAAQVVEHGDLLGHPYRVVPRQHDDHRAEQHGGGAAGHERQELQDVRAHGVAGEVVLDAPDRFEAERFGQVGEPDLVPIHLGVGLRGRRLEDRRIPDVHGRTLRPARWTASDRTVGSAAVQ